MELKDQEKQKECADKFCVGKTFATFFYSKLVEPPPIVFAYDFIIAINLSFLLKIFILIVITIIYLPCHFYVYFTEVRSRCEWRKITNHQYIIISLVQSVIMCMMQYTKRNERWWNNDLSLKNYWALFSFSKM